MGKINVEKGFNEITITFKWFQAIHIFLLFFFIAWDSFLLFWYFAIPTGDGISIIFMIFPLVHVAVGVAGTYFVLAGFLNKTTIRLTKSTLKMAHRPLPWIGGNKEIDIRNVTQFYVKQKITQNSKGADQISYQLRYLDNNKNDKNLIPKGITLESEDVQQIERLFEEFLGIKDFHVHGEYGAKSVQSTTSQQPFMFAQSHKPNNDPLERTIFDLQIGGWVDYKTESWQVKKAWQLDTDNNETYKQLLLETGFNEMHIFYQLSGSSVIYEEKEIPQMLINTNERLEKLPKDVEIKGETFYKSNTIHATKFDKNRNTLMYRTQIAFYSNSNHSQILRIELQNSHVNTIYQGIMLNQTSFSNILPPGDS